MNLADRTIYTIQTHAVKSGYYTIQHSCDQSSVQVIICYGKLKQRRLPPQVAVLVSACEYYYVQSVLQAMVTFDYV